MDLYDYYEKRLDLDQGISKVERLSLLNVLYQLKLEEDSSSFECYSIVKKLIVVYIDVVNERDEPGYDMISVSKLLSFIEPFSIEKKQELLSVAIRNLRRLEFHREADSLETNLHRNSLCYVWLTYKFERPFRLLYFLCTYNLYTILATFFFIPLIAIFILYPANITWLMCFEVESLPILSNKFLNHIANSLLLFTGGEGLKIRPLNMLGVFAYAIGKIFFVVLVVNVLIDRFNKYLHK